VTFTTYYINYQSINTILVKKGCLSIFGILYHNNFFVKKFRQNDVIGVSAFCQKGVFGNMSVHRLHSLNSNFSIKNDYWLMLSFG